MKHLTFVFLIVLTAQNVSGQEAPVHYISSELKDYYIREWVALGPFANEVMGMPTKERYTRRGFAKDLLLELGGETKAILTRETTLKNNALKAQLVSSEPNGTVDLTQIWGKGQLRAGYIFAWIQADATKEQVITFFFGSDDGAKVWINGELVHTAWVPGGRGVRTRSEYFKTTLKPGKNALLVKVDQNGPGWGAAVEALPREVARSELYPLLKPNTKANTYKEKDEWYMNVTPGLNHDETIFNDVPQDIVVVGANIKVIYKDKLATGTTKRLQIKTGIYSINTTAWLTSKMAHETGVIVSAHPEKLAKQQLIKAWVAKEDPRFESAAGWIDYLARRLDLAIKENKDSKTIEALSARINYWLIVLRENPKAHLDLKGIQEWAYLSKVDRTGQPFTLSIPDSYNPSIKWPLVVSMHGAGGNHGSDWGGNHDFPYFRLDVNGRGPMSGYTNLSEVEVLEATEYVQKNWNIDLKAVHLTGGSMGGYGTYILGSRHPDKWATAGPWAGSAAYLPVENMLNLPTYALHSNDDWVVPVSGSRAAVNRINQIGGTAILEETTGLGHDFGKWVEGKKHMLSWREGRQQSSFNNINRVHFTGMDEISRSAYWASIEEWGNEGKPAILDARFDTYGSLYVDTQNANSIKIALHDSPANTAKPLLVVINGKPIKNLPSPLPKNLLLKKELDGWRVYTEAPTETTTIRLHYPGGVSALYHGEPLLIVYGTKGDKKTTEKLLNLAKICSKRATFSLLEKNQRTLMHHGNIPIKMDSEVTTNDLKNNNLIVLGSTDENRIAQKYKAKLPVNFINSKGIWTIQSSDNQKWSANRSVMGLHFYNPEYPKRLMYWVAATDAAKYTNAEVLKILDAGNLPSPDLIIGNENGEMIAARRFDSKWNWEEGYQNSPKINESIGTNSFNDYLSNTLKDFLNVDFVVQSINETIIPKKLSNQARWADYRSFYYNNILGVLEVSGEILLKVYKSSKGQYSKIVLFPALDSSTIKNNEMYRIGLDGIDMRNFVKTTHIAPENFRLLNSEFRESIGKGLD